jgi:hypothetical protein
VSGTPDSQHISGGVLVNVASMAAYQPTRPWPSTAFVRSFTEAL